MYHATPKALIACLLALSLAACGDEGGDDSGDDSGSEGAASGFCDQANEMTAKHGAGWPVVEGRDIKAEWLAEFEAIEPAPEIADEWALLIRDYKAYGEAVADVDFDAIEQQMADVDPEEINSEGGSVPEGLGEAMAAADQAMAITQTEEHVNASNTVSQYLTDECA